MTLYSVFPIEPKISTVLILGCLTSSIKLCSVIVVYIVHSLSEFLQMSLSLEVSCVVVVVVQLLSLVQLFATPWTGGWQASLSITNSQSLLKLMSIESTVPPNHLILCCPFLLMPSIFPSVRGFSSVLALCIRWPKYWYFSLSISPSNEYSGLISFTID